MKKSVAILGSTGSIGRTSLDIFKKDSKKFNIILLSAKFKLFINNGAN